MKKTSEKVISVIEVLLLLISAWYCITETTAVKAAVSEGMSRCLNILIPSLYAMLAVSSLLTESGLLGLIPNFIKKAAHKIFGMDDDCFLIFLFSMTAGYPTGAKMICSEYQNGHIEKNSAELLMGVCFGAGPAFIFGCISGQLYGNAAVGQTILISTILANILLALLISPKLKKCSFKTSKKQSFHFSADMLTDCVMSAGRSMSGICLMVIIFAVVTSMLRTYGVLNVFSELLSSLTGLPYETSNAICCSFMDVSAISQLPSGNYALLPEICALVSFGGVCVMMQAAAITKGALSLRPLIALRSAAAVLSYFICRYIMKFTLADVTVPVSAGFSLHKAASPVPSVMILLMTFLLICECDGRKNEKI